MKTEADRAFAARLDLTTPDVMRLLGWSKQRVWLRFKRAGVAPVARGQSNYYSYQDVLVAFPELARRAALASLDADAGE